ncbi:hypothetical protein NIA69_10400 [Gemmiger formicilis]|nr:hypothetical protein [Gemmiger formicilis]
MENLIFGAFATLDGYREGTLPIWAARSMTAAPSWRCAAPRRRTLPAQWPC